MKPDEEQIRSDFTSRHESLLTKYDQGKLLFEQIFPVALFGELFDKKRIAFLSGPNEQLEIEFGYATDSVWFCIIGKTTTPVDPIMLLAIVLNCGLCQVILFLEKYGLKFSLPEVAVTPLSEITKWQLSGDKLEVLGESDPRPLHAFYECLFKFEYEIQEQLLPGSTGKQIIPEISNEQEVVSTGKEEPASSDELSGGQLWPDPVSNEQLIARCSYEAKDEMELVKRHFEPSDHLQAKLFMTATDIHRYLANRYGEGWFRGDLARLGKLMNSDGYHKARSKHNGIYGYFLILKDAGADAA